MAPTWRAVVSQSGSKPKACITGSAKAAPVSAPVLAASPYGLVSGTSYPSACAAAPARLAHGRHDGSTRPDSIYGSANCAPASAPLVTGLIWWAINSGATAVRFSKLGSAGKAGA